MRKSRDKVFINVNKISSISKYKIITLRTKKQIRIGFQAVRLCEDMNHLIIFDKLKLLCITPIQKITGLSFQESLFEAFKRSAKAVIKNNKL